MRMDRQTRAQCAVWIASSWLVVEVRTPDRARRATRASCRHGRDGSTHTTNNPVSDRRRRTRVRGVCASVPIRRAPNAMASNIVAEWLRSLHLGQYAESFIDNGYDDLEICKQVGDPDLDAIGVLNPVHRARLLQSVRTLREEGAASVYFTLEESVAVHEECLCDNVSARSSRTSSGRSDKDTATIARLNASPGASSSIEGNQEVAKYMDEYEEGKAELVKIPRIQLKILLREKLTQDGVRLSCQPYSTPVSCDHVLSHHTHAPLV